MILDLAPWLENSRWQTVPISFLARQGTGHTPSRQHPEYWENCTIPWITLADVWQLRDGTRHTVTETKEKISLLGLAHSAAVVHPKGTVILSRTASVGFSGIMGADMATSQDFATWTCGPKLLPRFLLHALRAMAPDLKRLAAGSTHKTIYMPDIERLRIPVPALEEQRRIADFLDAETAHIDRLSALRSKQVELVGERASSLIAGRVEELASVNGWIRLKRGLRSIEQGWSPQCHDIEAGVDECAVLKTSAVSSGVFRGEQHKLLPPELEPDLRYLVRDGDLLMTRGSGSPRLVGVAAVADTKGRKLLLSDLLYRLRLHPGWSSTFVASVLASSPVRSRMRLLMRGQSGQTIKLRAEDIREISIPRLAVDDQSGWAKEVDRVRAEANALMRSLERSIELLEERRRAVVTAAVTGELDVTTAGRGSFV
ncbi:restriction endonuclease subunit S [Actinomadura monticuli]|uniref:Restriction endonuclease subunit S n=1 Tax=Actinomadura monticuli TaxID=3097367 RepID=A0ABV4QC08_9ACTN